MLEARNLWFKYSDSDYVLKGVNLEVNGGLACILGPNGAGKTTLIKCLVGALRPERGEIIIDGVGVSGLSLRERAKLISYVPQEFSINFSYTVLEVVLMGRNPHVNPFAGPSKADERAALEALRVLGIEHLSTRPFTSLSGGEKRLVLIARALAQNGKVLVMDEPTSFLDYRNQLKVLKVAREVSKCLGKDVLVTLHDPNLALLFCDKVFLMDHGEIVCSGPPKEVISECVMKRIYGVEVRVIKVGSESLVIPNTR